MRLRCPAALHALQACFKCGPRDSTGRIQSIVYSHIWQSRATGGDVSGSFVHLHTHSEFSILDGASQIEDLVAAAVADKQPALGITDHGNMYAVLDFYRACHAAGITPVIGTEAYMAKDSRTERPARRGRIDDAGGDTDSGKLYYHITLLAENDTGYRNLIQVASRAFLEGYYYKPRCDWETLADHSEGLIATTGCLGGQVPQFLLRGDIDEALARAGRLQEIFGRDNFFVEMQDHGIPEQHQINPHLIDIAKKLDAPLLGTNDSHYTRREDADAHDALLCVQTGSLLADTDRLKFHGSEHYLKTSAEMRSLFSEIPQACDNTLWIAERADVKIEFGQPKLPRFVVPEDFTDDREYLLHLTLEGAKARWGDPLPDYAADRLSYELDVINNMGFASYFLITWDLIAHARRQGIRVGPGRGSAAGCAVAYSLRITDLDPIHYGLLFERFLNPSRVSMPDIDIDFDSRRRDEMIAYTAERYGRDHVAQIITFGRIKARAAVRDAARVLGLPASLGDRISKAMPEMVMGRDTPLRHCLERTEGHHDGYAAAADLRQLIAADPDAAAVMDVAKGIEGRRRQDGIHAAAVVIAPEPLTNYMPIQRKPASGADPESAPIVTQYEMHGVEDLGLLKMDFLGLRNLDVLSDTVELVQSTRGETIDPDNLPLDDEATFKMLQRGETVGVFQLESAQMRRLVQALEPDRFEDICALVALYRPGPMAANMHLDYAERKNSRSSVEYFHPDAADILDETYGLMIYQESVMRVAQRFAGYSLAEADTLRKAMGKKIRSAMAAEHDKFVTGVVDNGYEHHLGEKLFNIIEQFADYAFNKSHSYGYGMISYQTAYLKANYPTEYLAAVLTSVRAKQDSVSVYLKECSRSSIEVLVPDINRSGTHFTPLPAASPGSPGRVAYGLAAVRNVGEALVERAVAERDANGVYGSFTDFVERVDMDAINRRAVESLIKAGAFDSLGHPRKGLLHVHETIIDMTLRARREHAAGVLSLFGTENSGPTFEERPAIPDVEYVRSSKLAHEKEMLGMYVSDHPLKGMEGRIRRRADRSIADLRPTAGEATDTMFCTVGGVMSGLNKRWTRKGELMASFELEDLHDKVEVLVFPKTMAEHGHKLADDIIVIVAGRLDAREDSPRFAAHNIEIVEHVDEDQPLRVNFKADHHSNQRLGQLRALLEAHPGDVPVELHLNDGRVAHLSGQFNVSKDDGLPAELRELLGADAIARA